MTDLSKIMATARTAFEKSAAAPPKERIFFISRLIQAIVERRREIASVISSDTGKTVAEAVLTDLIPTLEMLRYLEANTERVLRDRQVGTPLIFWRSRSFVQYRPKGIVLVIAPWNNPFQLSMIPAMTALAAGNAVILKPSEKTPKTAALIRDLFNQSGIEAGVMQVAEGGAETASRLIDAAPDMIFFTGSSRSGAEIMRRAAAKMIPVLLELGGKDAMLIFEDANLDRAAGAALYGAFAHAGQHCVSTKRIFIQKNIYSRFIERFIEKTRALAETNEWGRAADERAIQAAKAQIEDAVKRGASLLFPEVIEKAGQTPTIVANCAPDMAIMREETFAPVVGVMSLETEEEGIRLVNDSIYGLNASLWTEDERRAERVVRRIQTGNIFVNHVLVNIGNPHLPFGGVKMSGLGRYHGEEGLKAFCSETSVMICGNKGRDEPPWFPHDAAKEDMIDALAHLRYGKIGLWKSIFKWFNLFKKWKGGRHS